MFAQNQMLCLELRLWLGKVQLDNQLSRSVLGRVSIVIIHELVVRALSSVYVISIEQDTIFEGGADSGN